MIQRIHILMALLLLATSGVTQPMSGDCDNLVYAAREMFNRGELPGVLDMLKPCLDNTHLNLRQRRGLYRLVAETHLYLRDYPSAAQYARLLAESDPKLDVFGFSGLGSSRNKLRAAIQSRYVDAPDLLLLISNIRYRAIGAEVFGGIATEMLHVKEERRANGVSDVFDEKWSEARRMTFGAGIKYDPYRFPLTLSFRASKSEVAFVYRDAQEIDGVDATMTYEEKQDWVSPELWFGYQFAARTFPVKSVDISLRAGIGADILTSSMLEGALLDREDGNDWYGGQQRDITNLISQKIYPVVLGAVAIDYRIGMPSVFLEFQYRHPIMDKYVYEIPAAPYASSVRGVQSIGVQAGVRYVFYKAFYK